MALPEQLQNLRIPLIGSPLFIVSNPELVIAQCTSGIVGSFPALNAREAPGEAIELDKWLTRISEALDAHNQSDPDHPAAPFAVNQIVHKSNARLERDVEICVKHKVPIWITSLGAQDWVYEAAHSVGAIVLHDIINDFFARKAIAKGADGLIAVAAGAGGHAGSAFIATDEANAAEGYKQMITAGGASDIVYSDLFTGVWGNYLKPSITAAGMDPNALERSDPSAMNFASGDGSKAKKWKDIWGSGQGIGRVRDVVPTATLVNRLADEYAAAQTRLAGTLGWPIQAKAAE